MIQQILNIMPPDYPNSLIPFQSKTVILWRFDVTGHSTTYLRLHMYSDLMKIGFYRHIFAKSPMSYLKVIRPVGAALIHAGEINRRLSPLKTRVRCRGVCSFPRSFLSLVHCLICIRSRSWVRTRFAWMLRKQRSERIGIVTYSFTYV
jgi:hypothetical protein